MTGDEASAQAVVDTVMAEVGGDYNEWETIDAIMAEVAKIKEGDAAVSELAATGKEDAAVQEPLT